MIFIVPTNTDAPIYHWPVATLSLIAVNIGTFVLTGYGLSDNYSQWQHWTLEFGGRLDPLEWVSCHFLHFGFLHLLGNMVFLWGFGLVVEGKIGWQRFLGVYFGIGILGAALIQTAMLAADNVGDAGGASLIIFGLLAMCLVWAPKNEVTVLFFFVYRVFLFEVTILTFGIYYFGWELLMAALRGFSMSGSIAHLTGGALGFALGTFMLKRRWVDCENWDLFAVIHGDYGRREDVSWPMLSGEYASTITRPEGGIPDAELPLDIPPPNDEDLLHRQDMQRKRTLRRIRQLLQQEKPRAALAEYQRLKHVLTGWQLDGRELKALADGLYKQQAWSDAVPLMEEFVQRFPAKAAPVRLKLAGVALEVQRRPRFALRLLEEIPQETLTDTLSDYYRRMHRKAQKMIDEGVIELEGQSWK